MNVFNLISAGGGSGSGLYIWKKLSVQTYKRATTGLPYQADLLTSDKDIVLYSADHFDFTFDTATGLYTLTSPTTRTLKIGEATTFTSAQKFIVDSPTGKTMYSAWSGGYANTYTWTSDGKLSVTGNSASKTCTIYSAEPDTYTFIDYVISDDENAYPSAGTQGGYYYERAIALNPADYGCTKVTIGSFTPSSSTASKTISHNMGLVPKFAIIFPSTTSSNGTLCNITVFVTNTTSANGLFCTLYSSGTASGYGTTPGAYTTYVDLYTVDSTSGNFYAGVKYNYMIFA